MDGCDWTGIENISKGIVVTLFLLVLPLVGDVETHDFRLLLLFLFFKKEGK